MATSFSPVDFVDTIRTCFILWNSTPTTTSALRHLAKSLRKLHTALSELHAQAESSASLLRVRCSDRRPEWLDMRAALERQLEHIHVLLLEGDFVESHVNVLVAKLRMGITKVETFVDSLGLREGRSGGDDPIGVRENEVLAKAERCLLNAVFEERTRVRRRKVLDAWEAGWWGVVEEVLSRAGVGRVELRVYERELREILDWVVENEPEVTRLRENAGLNVYMSIEV